MLYRRNQIDVIFAPSNGLLKITTVRHWQTGERTIILTFFREMHFEKVATRITDYLLPATKHYRTLKHLLHYQTPHWSRDNHKWSFCISTTTPWNALQTNSWLLCLPPDLFPRLYLGSSYLTRKQ